MEEIMQGDAETDDLFSPHVKACDAYSFLFTHDSISMHAPLSISSQAVVYARTSIIFFEKNMDAGQEYLI